jgi:hypothetical protein
MDKERPLVSCVMPTSNRADFAVQSVEYFLRQNYPERELIILDDSVRPFGHRLPDDARIRYVHSASRVSLGAKRNLGCEMARGEIIVQWDDDDWFGPDRLALQVAALRDADADVVGFAADLFFDLTRWAFWRMTPELNTRVAGEIHLSTMGYRRSLWEEGVRYPPVSMGEDIGFMRRARQRGVRCKAIANQGQFVYLRHGGNTWSFVCGMHVDKGGWYRTGEPVSMAQDRAFYEAHTPAVLTPPEQEWNLAPHRQLPRVSCLLFPHGRIDLALLAVECFRRQSYPNRELLIWDETGELRDLVPSDPSIRFVTVDTDLTPGAQRNRACAVAQGEIILHWDALGWMADRRIESQVERLLLRNADVCGTQRLLHYDPSTGEAWEYLYPGGFRFLMASETLCYRRQFWEVNPFPETGEAPDAHFLWTNRRKLTLRLPDNSLCVALRPPLDSGGAAGQTITQMPYALESIQALLPDAGFLSAVP